MLRKARSILQSIILAGGLLLVGTCNFSLAQNCCSGSIGGLKEINDFEVEPEMEQELLALVNQHRRNHELPPLSLDTTLTQIARYHSQGMANQGFISHNLPSGNLKERLSRAGYLYEIARENVASAPTVRIAQAAFMDSPGHERNMLADDISNVGIGIALCPSPYSNQLFITEIFADPREEYQTEMVEKVLASRVDELRQHGAGSMLLDPDLEKLAIRSLNSMNLPYKREEIQSLLSATATELPDSNKSALSLLRANVQLVHNPRNLNIPNYAGELQARSYGAAIRQVTDSQNQSAFLVLMLIGLTP